MFTHLSGGFAALIQNFAVAFIPAFLGLILHEVGHGVAALYQGDPTARNLGRLTLNPIPHIDIAGLITFIVTAVSGLFVFGWAKPVPFDPRYFRNPKKGMMLVALAGPVTNIILAVLFGLLLKIFIVCLPPYLWMQNATYMFFIKMLQAGIFINFGLAFFNLIPIPPLDGSKVLAYFLPQQTAWKYLSIERYGFLILMLLIFLGAFSTVLGPLIYGGYSLILVIFGIL